MTDCPFTLLASLILLYHFQTRGKGTPQTTTEDVASSSRHYDSINLTDGPVNFMFIYLTNSFWSFHILMCRPKGDVQSNQLEIFTKDHTIKNISVVTSVV